MSCHACVFGRIFKSDRYTNSVKESCCRGLRKSLANFARSLQKSCGDYEHFLLFDQKNAISDDQEEILEILRYHEQEESMREIKGVSQFYRLRLASYL